MRERNGELLNGSAKRGPQLPLASLQIIASLRVLECQQCEQVVGNLEIMLFLKTGNPRPREGTDGLGPLREKVEGSSPGPGLLQHKLRVISLSLYQLPTPVWFMRTVPRAGDPKVGPSKGQAEAVIVGAGPVAGAASCRWNVPSQRAAGPSSSAPGWDACPMLTQLPDFPRQVTNADSYVKSPSG